MPLLYLSLPFAAELASTYLMYVLHYTISGLSEAVNILAESQTAVM